MDFAHLVRALLGRRFAMLHFVALGALLFALQQAFLAPGLRQGSLEGAAWPALDGRQKSEIDDELLYREGLRRGLDRDDGVIRQRLIQDMRFLEPENASSDDALYRQALELGLDREDVVVRRRLVEKMRRHVLTQAPIPRPADGELEGYLAEQADRFVIPARVRLDQVHFDEPERAQAALEALAAGQLEAQALRGDPLPLPRRLPSLSARELAGRLGPAFAARSFELPPGRWSGPVGSSYGHSLVFVHDQTPKRMPRLDEVRARVEGEWLAEREALALEAALGKLRAQAGLESASAAPPAKGTVSD